MIPVNDRLKIIVTIGEELNEFCLGMKSGRQAGGFAEMMNEAIAKAKDGNPWFTDENIIHALDSWSEALQEKSVYHWFGRYEGRLKDVDRPASIGLVLAGNIPMVGFHDILCVLLSGHNAIARLSSDDKYLIPAIFSYISARLGVLDSAIRFTEDRLSGFDAIIATGSNNTSRYFEYYFGKYPNIIRKNRNGLAVLTGNESGQELKLLGEDIFRYFGLGCRNVSLILVPEDFNIIRLLDSLEPYQGVSMHHKYTNNYDYQKSLLLINGTAHLDTGFALFRESSDLSSPVSVVHFKRYKSLDWVKDFLVLNGDRIQCVVSSGFGAAGAVPPGRSQKPALWDYADDVDVMDFLLEVSRGAG